MNRDEILDRITIDPGVLVGKGTIRGMRISVEQILEALAAGVPEEELLEDYPALEPEDIRAALPYARASLQQNGFTPWTHEFLHERTAPSGGCERWPCRCPSLRER